MVISQGGRLPSRSSDRTGSFRVVASDESESNDDGGSEPDGRGVECAVCKERFETAEERNEHLVAEHDL